MTSSILLRCSRPALAGALLLAWAGGAAAQETASVALNTSTCTPSEDAALRRALEIELRARHVEPRWQSPDAAGPPARFTLHAQCSASSDDVSLRVWANEPELLLTRSVGLRDVAETARARTLALVISEALGPTLVSRADTGDDAAYVAAATAPDTADAAPASERLAPLTRADARDDETLAPSAMATGSRRRPSLGRTNTDGALDELYTTSNPYGMARGFRLGAGAQGRLAMRDGSVLLGFELAANGPASPALDWAIEVSHAGSTTWTDGLDVSWWSAALGIDLVRIRAVGLAAGPRLSFGYLEIGNDGAFDAATERTLVSQLGARGKFEAPLGELTSLQLTFSVTHTLGVYALTPYTGLDEGLNGWVIGWGLGLGVAP